MKIVEMIEARGLRDVEGRPLREGRTPAELLRPDDIEYKPCPYAGSRTRSGKPMNASALRQMGRALGRGVHDARRVARGTRSRARRDGAGADGHLAHEPARVGAAVVAPVYAGFKLLMWIYFLARRFLWADAGVPQDGAVEPSDFFIVEPANLAEVTREQRAGWFRQLADLVVPFAPRGADLALRDHAFAFATVMGSSQCSFAALETIFASVVAVVETAFGGSPPSPITPAILDRIVPRRHAELAKPPNASGA